MPFGARMHEGATTRFRLWAPAARRVDVMLGDPHDARAVSMQSAGEGWFETTSDGAPAGTRYAFRIDGDRRVPDPASRFNPDGVHEASVVVDPAAYDWRDARWRGRPWHEAVVYELHVGTFTLRGTFAGAVDRLDHLVDTGVTALELLPVAAFAGARGWGYDGVLPFAPHAAYGTPDDLKRLVDEAHARGLMVLLDVVYNHFGPDGNYLHAYAPQFFNPRHPTPWGPAINFDGERNATVREFYVHNALYWLEEFHLDGLRLDAVHAIVDDSRPDIVDELAARVRETVGETRHVHLVLENDRNEAGRLARAAHGRPLRADAQWNDDFHHALHVIATGERDGYYADYADHPLHDFGRALAQGFVYQGQASPFRDGARRGEPSTALPPIAFVAFAQNHDQAGNRAFGERIGRIARREPLDVVLACMLLAPAIPMLFMGEEFDASTPFLFFCDYGPELARAVAAGRREEFARFESFGGRSPDEIPDPNARSTFEASRLDWAERERPAGAQRLALYRRCLAARREHVVPLLRSIRRGGTYDVVDDAVVIARWPVRDGRRLVLVANLSDRERVDAAVPQGCALHVEPIASASASGQALPPWTVRLLLEQA